MTDQKDELAQINGVKPKKVIAEGQEVEAKSQTSSAVYKIKRTWDHYYCTCPAWRNQSGAPVSARTCKHLKSVLGEAYENERLKLMNPDGYQGTKKPSSKSKGKKPVSKATKRKKADEEDGDEEDEDADNGGRSKKRTRRTTARKPASKGKDNGADDEGEADDKEDEEEMDVDGDDEVGNSGKTKVDVLLAVKWDLEKGADPTGWWVSEKLDGVRVYYDGKRMFSRLGNQFTPPKWFIEKLPKDVTLDGELFGGRGQFQSTVSIVKTPNTPRWKEITFQVFDVPSMGEEPFEDRLAWLNSSFKLKTGGPKIEHVRVVDHVQAESRDHVRDMLNEIEDVGGEGLMLRKPGSQYEGKRSSTLQKVKTFFDAEAKVTGYVPGKGKNAGSTGALKCVMASGKTFNVGTGFSDKQRRSPPKVGSIITYRFQELTWDGVPRFPTFVGEAADKDEPKDADIPANRKIGAKGADKGDSS